MIAAEPNKRSLIDYLMFVKISKYTTVRNTENETEKFSNCQIQTWIPDGQIILEIGQHNANNCAHSTRNQTNEENTTTKITVKEENNGKEETWYELNRIQIFIFIKTFYVWCFLSALIWTTL